MSGHHVADGTCPALAQRLQLPVRTADRAWADLDPGTGVQVVR